MYTTVLGQTERNSTGGVVPHQALEKRIALEVLALVEVGHSAPHTGEEELHLELETRVQH